LAKDFFPKSSLVKINKFFSPANCLWLNAIVGVCFLLPFPTWQQLVDFLSSIVVFSYLSGPIALIVMRQEFPDIKRPFRLYSYKLIGYSGFACCTLLIYWSSLSNLIYLILLVLAVIISYNTLIDGRHRSLLESLKTNFFVLVYLLEIILIKYLHQINLVSFPFDNFLVIIISLFACKTFINNRINGAEINNNLVRFSTENIL
jgi:amino acid transporter